MKDNQKRILITGAGGFIGKHLFEYLKNKINCTQVYRLFRNREVEGNFDVDNNVFCELEQASEVGHIIKEINPQIVFHLAANTKPTRNVRDIMELVQANIIGTINLITPLIEQNKVERFINVGTCEEYGYNKQPFIEDQIPDPISLYSGTKAANSMLNRMFYNICQFPVTTVRPSLVYGPGQSERFFVVQAIKKLIENKRFEMTEGYQTRDFIYIDDFITGLLAVTDEKKFIGECVNVCSGVEIPLRDIIHIIRNITSSNSDIRMGIVPMRSTEIMSFRCDNSKIRKHTSWSPTTSIYDGLLQTINYYKNLGGLS